MPIPAFQSILLPLLKFAATRTEVSVKDAYAQMASAFKLSDAELQELLPSGNGSLFKNRVAWAKQYLIYASLLASVKRGVFSITDLGRKWAKEKTSPIKISDFKVIPGYLERVQGSGDSDGEPKSTVVEDVSTTPEEQMQSAYIQIRQRLIAELLERIHQKPPKFFETLVLDLMAALGYGDGTTDSLLHTGQTGDGGIDGKIKMDVLGIEHIFIQAKRYDLDKTISREQVAAFAGSVHGAKGVFVTTAKFSPQAIAFMEKDHRQIVLIDGQRLGDLMLKSGLGVTAKKALSIFHIDEDYFSDDE